jgi:hypothetical protein
MRASSRIVLNSLDGVFSGGHPVEINNSYSPLVTTTSMSDGDSTAIVSSSFPMALL